ncbi:MAG TPA: F0F1 ATP synthase subunit B [Ktedonobacterales bacterium]|jgi:F-type H+-transporting ATPase subunit b|nr:F0F1 ATP synthase subunit B [Ktedonobacterales bacterium]
MGALGINLGSLIAQLVAFVILLLVLQRFAFPVLTKTLDQRQARIREGIENAERASQALKDAEKRVEALMNDARLESQKVIASATQAAERLKADIEQQAQQRGREIEQQAAKRIEQQISQAKAELRAHVADLSIAAAERVIGQSLDSATNRRLVDEFVSQSRDSLC